MKVPERFASISEHEEVVPLVSLNLSPLGNSSLRSGQSVELIKDLHSAQDLSKNGTMKIIHSGLQVVY